MTQYFSLDELTGRARSHITEVEEPSCALHRDAVEPFQAMRAAAAVNGIDLVPFSSFRDFTRQLAIWNGKARGERAVLDAAGHPLDVDTLDESARVDAILHWSALPGASRHHWGTDMDVMDAAALPPGYKLQVIPGEYAPGGPFSRLDAWLEEHAATFGFYRPYTTWRGGVQPEPWHLSYAPVATLALEQLTLEALRTALDSADICARAAIDAKLPEILARYVRNVDAPPPEALSSRVTRRA